MITVRTAGFQATVTPTIFPDGTSQVWKLPKGITESYNGAVDWHFESEREILDILSLRKLLHWQDLDLYVPYLPYARQDKEVSNSATFNLEVFADLLNQAKFTSVYSFDVHNPARTERLIHNFFSQSAHGFHIETINKSKPDYIVFPDAGAAERYLQGLDHLPKVVCDKTRDQLTGEITGHKVLYQDAYVSNLTAPPAIPEGARFLIVDDLCDGGATFISVAKLLRELQPSAVVDLCVSHGVFSKGREHLFTNGISNVYTTNSLTKNGDGFNV